MAHPPSPQDHSTSHLIPPPCYMTTTTRPSSNPPSPSTLLMTILLLFLLGAVNDVSGDIASDKQECQETLVQMVTCLPYVQGSANVPTPDCCNGLNQVVAKSPRCLCILIKDRDDPSLNLKVDLTKALTLQSKCKVPGDTSMCPKLLNLDPNSTEAQVFKQFGSAKNGSTSGPAGRGGVAPSTSSSGKSSNATTTTSTSTSSGGWSYHYREGGRRWLGLEVVFGELWMYCLALLVITLWSG